MKGVAQASHYLLRRVPIAIRSKADQVDEEYRNFLKPLWRDLAGSLKLSNRVCWKHVVQ